MAPLRLVIFALLLMALIIGSESRPLTFPQRTQTKRCPPGYRMIRNVGCRKIISISSRHTVI
ncbi:hypothetical protein WN55_02748 [Dufourea novaeangliae]|uniref:Uncharacterized protein n=1 Tax=Dufourea novaeangliae TaxID=178035 RepID=A0A154NXJ4_DUFNO|nr:hypothetical protein WN55_02748 [Dufourea novaeangliae]